MGCYNLNMSTKISFDENKYQIKSRSILGESQVPAMTKFLLNNGIVKTEKTAHFLMLSGAGLFFLGAIYVFAVYVLGVNIGGNKTLTPEEAQQRSDELKIQINDRRNGNVNNIIQNNQ
jgi:hypothetical protein